MMNNISKMWCLCMVAVLLSAVCGLEATQAQTPLLYGVTGGSTYKEYVRLYWFDEEATATVSVDGGPPTPYTKGAVLNVNGQYAVSLSVIKNNETYVNNVSFTIDSTQSAADIKTLVDPALTKLSIEFEPGTYSGNPMMVIWAEDMAGNFLQNLYVSTAAATNYMRFTNSSVSRPQGLPYWAHKACPASINGGDTIYVADPFTPLPEGLDGVSGATQKLGFNLDAHIPAYGANPMVKILLEINQSFDDGWYFSASNALREETDEPSGETFGDDRFFGGSEEPSMIYAVEVPIDQAGLYTTNEPAGYGHYGGRTGTLYTDFYALDGENERHKFDYATDMVQNLSVTVHKLQGDVTGDYVVNLQDAIVGLQICLGDDVSANMNSDVGANERLGVEEVIYVLDQAVQ